MEVLAVFLVSAGFAWWLGRRGALVRAKRFRALLGPVGDDASVVLAVAKREAEQRHHALAPIHVIYGLLQDEAFRETLTRLGGDPEASENRVLDALDRVEQPADLAMRESPENAAFAVVMARMYARHHERPVTPADLWSAIARTTDAALVDRPGLLFALVHGGDEPRSALAGETRVAVVLRNDDYTTMDFVMSLLREVFELSNEDAHRIMLDTHQAGRGVVGSFDATKAKSLVETAWSRARDARYPLWISVEVA